MRPHRKQAKTRRTKPTKSPAKRASFDYLRPSEPEEDDWDFVEPCEPPPLWEPPEFDDEDEPYPDDRDFWREPEESDI